MPEINTEYLLKWDQVAERFYETGCDHGVLYVKDDNPETNIPTIANEDFLGGAAKTHYSKGVVWNGLTSVSKTPSGADANDIYADNIKYASLRAAETFGGTIESYMYPPEFAVCDGSATVGDGVYVGQQRRKMFGFVFRSDVGRAAENGIDVNNDYKLHLVYNATASPSEQQYSTINDSPDAITMSWEFSTIPEIVGSITTGSGQSAVTTTYLPTATITIDATKLKTTAQEAKLATLLQVLYGTPAVEADQANNIEAQDAREGMLPMPKDVIKFFAS